ncbi:MAG TPA: hypothetical protein VEW03_02615 [Longimicrobiaceae bacterium]|nr:hypothetical protein [Longimicrobiaceae bacterium]
MAAAELAGVPETPARLSFSGKTTEARARVIERTAAWRHASAARQLGWLLLVPVVVWAPPHFPWVLAVLAIGGMRAFGRLREHRTLLSLRGACPKCGMEQDFHEVGRMKSPHKVTCAGCRWDVFAEVARAGAET